MADTMIEPFGTRARNWYSRRTFTFPWRLGFITAIIALLIVLLGMVRAIGTKRIIPPEHTSVVEVHPSPDVVLAMRELARLETASFHMERVVEASDRQTRMWGLMDVNDSLLLVAAGDVVAGVDLQKLAAADVRVDWAGKRVSVQLPAPEVFSAALDSARTHVHSRHTDPMAHRNEGLEGQARADAERTMRRGAIQGGILDRARSSAEHEVTALLHSMGFAQIEVVWKPAPRVE